MEGSPRRGGARKETCWITSMQQTEFTAGPRETAVGLIFRALPPDHLVVLKVAPGSWAEDMGIRPGDAFDAVNGIHVSELSADEFLCLMKQRPFSLRPCREDRSKETRRPYCAWMPPVANMQRALSKPDSPTGARLPVPAPEQSPSATPRSVSSLFQQTPRLSVSPRLSHRGRVRSSTAGLAHLVAAREIGALRDVLDEAEAVAKRCPGEADCPYSGRRLSMDEAGVPSLTLAAMCRTDGRRQGTDETSTPPASSTAGRVDGALLSSPSSAGEVVQAAGRTGGTSPPAHSPAVAVEHAVARRDNDGLVVVDAVSASKRSQRIAAERPPEVECLCAAMEAARAIARESRGSSEAG